MKKKNGFISMSIIYSFFAVFTLVSSSLLLVYSTNLSIVKEKNREIKNELTENGNSSMMLFKNLIVDGGFEEYTLHDENFNWGKSYQTTIANPNAYELLDDIRPKQTVLHNDEGKGAWRSRYTDENHLRKLIMGSDAVKYSGFGALGFKGRERNSDDYTHNEIQSNQTIHMIQYHYYYISRVYYAWNNISGEELKLGLMKYDEALSNEENDASSWETDPSNWDTTDETRYYDILENAEGYDGGDFNRKKYYNTNINYSRERIESGYCLGVNGRCADPEGAFDCEHTPDWAKTGNGTTCEMKSDRVSKTNANTFESGIFYFTGEDGEYRLLIGENFDTISNVDVQPYYVTDNYTLIDINVSFQYGGELEGYLNTNSKLRKATKNIDDMLDGRFFEGSKVFSKARFNILS